MNLWYFLTYIMGIEIIAEGNTFSSGNCEYAARTLQKKCTGKVTKETSMRWMDPFAPVDTHYEIWTAPDDGDVVVATFFESEFSKQDEIDLDCIGSSEYYCDFDSFDEYWHVHCFNHALGYLEDLRTSCLGLKYDLNKTVAKPAILYTKLTVVKQKTS